MTEEGKHILHFSGVDASLAALGALGYIPELVHQENWRARCEEVARGVPSLQALLSRLREHWPGQDERIYHQFCTGYFPGEQPPPPTAEDWQRFNETILGSILQERHYQALKQRIRHQRKRGKR